MSSKSPASPGTMQVWAEPFTKLAPGQDLQSVPGPIRTGRYHVQHLLRLGRWTTPSWRHLRRDGLTSPAAWGELQGLSRRAQNPPSFVPTNILDERDSTRSRRRARLAIDRRRATRWLAPRQRSESTGGRHPGGRGAVRRRPSAVADEGGVSFWLPGQFGSLAAAPTEPGWSLPSVYYYTTSHAEAGDEFPLSGRVTADLDASAALLFVAPSLRLPDSRCSARRPRSRSEAPWVGLR